MASAAEGRAESAKCPYTRLRVLKENEEIRRALSAAVPECHRWR